MGGLHHQLLHTVGDSALQSLVHVVDLLAVTGLDVVDDDLSGEGAAHGPIGVSRLQGVLNALDVGYAAVVEGGAEGHHQQLLLADLVLVAGIVLGCVTGVQTEIVGAGFLTLHQRLLGVGQGIPSGLGGLTLGVGLLGALLHVDGVDEGGDLIGGALSVFSVFTSLLSLLPQAVSMLISITAAIRKASAFFMVDLPLSKYLF